MAPSIRTALISVSDKSLALPLAIALAEHGIEIIATHHTAKFLAEHGLQTTSIESLTGYPPLLQGRVKTLHPAICAPILAPNAEALETSNIPKTIDLVCVSLYPFSKHSSTEDEDWVECIDIGGVTLLRSAAKNHQRVTVVCDAQDIPCIIKTLPEAPDLAIRKKFALKAFETCLAHDQTILTRLSASTSEPPSLINCSQHTPLRYGENPHQAATLAAHHPPLYTQVQGKHLSYNNMLDIDTAYPCVWDFQKPTCVIVKHASPAGVGHGASALEAYTRALACDPLSAFGGVVAFNQPLDAHTAQTMIDSQFIEVIIAPTIETEALNQLSKKPNCRVLIWPTSQQKLQPDWQIRSSTCGLLMQRNTTPPDTEPWRCVTDTSPSAAIQTILDFGYTTVKWVKSNAIVLANTHRTIGIGCGQMSRIDSLTLARHKAEQTDTSTQGSILASDAFFPFPDIIEQAAQAGIIAIIQPGGSRNDAAVIQAANNAGICMLMTGMRHFRH